MPAATPPFFVRSDKVRPHLAAEGVPCRVLADQLDITRPYLYQLLNRRRHLSAELRYRMRKVPALKGLAPEELWYQGDPEVLPRSTDG
jgi:hypothetical protein